MELIKIFQTTGSNTDLLSMRTFKAFTVVVYDFWMSECIKANRRTPALGRCYNRWKIKRGQVLRKSPVLELGRKVFLP